MQVVLREKDVYMLSVAPGEDVIEALKEFCEREKIKAGSFTGIGAVRETELAWYDVDEKSYATRALEEKLEMVGLIGDVTTFEGGIIIHAHGTFSNNNMEMYAGHVNRAVVAAACEITLRRFSGEIRREYSEETGLNLMRD